MEFGINFFPDVQPADKSAARYFTECLEVVRMLEARGYTHIRIVEHYFRAYGGYSPNPMLFLAAAAMCTKTIRLITGAVLPAFNHPLKLAGEAGMLDALSGGRLEIGFARAFLPHEFERFGIEMDSSRDRFEEGVDAVVDLLEREKVSMDGKFHSFPATTSLPRPTQKPRPPMWVAALSSTESFRRAGERGFGVMANPIAPDSLRANIQEYRDAWRSSGYPGSGKVMLAFHMYCADDTDTAMGDAAAPINRYLTSLVAAASEWSEDRTSDDYPGYDRMIANLAQDDCHSLMARGAALVGTPDTIVEQFSRFYDECGGFDSASLQVNFSSLDSEKAKMSVDLFAQQALPRLAKIGETLN